MLFNRKYYKYPHKIELKIKQKYRTKNKGLENHAVVQNYEISNRYVYCIIMKTFHTDVYYLQQYRISTNRRRYYQATKV